MQRQGNISVKDIVTDIQAVSGDLSGNLNYTVLTRCVRRVVEEQMIYTFPIVHSKLFTLDNTLSIACPKDSLHIYKVGYITSCGRLVKMSRREGQVYKSSVIEELTNERGDVCACSDTDIVQPDTTEEDLNPYAEYFIGYGSRYAFGYTFFNFTSGSISNTELYGVAPPADKVCYYSENLSKGRVDIDGWNVRSGMRVVMEYTSSVGGDDYKNIPQDAYYIIFHKAMNMYYSGRDVNLAEYNMRQFQRHLMEYKKLNRNYDLSTIVNAMRSTYRRTPKR